MTKMHELKCVTCEGTGLLPSNRTMWKVEACNVCNGYGHVIIDECGVKHKYAVKSCEVLRRNSMIVEYEREW